MLQRPYQGRMWLFQHPDMSWHVRRIPAADSEGADVRLLRHRLQRFVFHPCQSPPVRWGVLARPRSQVIFSNVYVHEGPQGCLRALAGCQLAVMFTNCRQAAHRRPPTRSPARSGGTDTGGLEKLTALSFARRRGIWRFCRP
jgi:hypothetical protein